MMKQFEVGDQISTLFIIGDIDRRENIVGKYGHCPFSETDDYICWIYWIYIQQV